MAKIFLYAHGGSGNHGCEAIVRATRKLLNDSDITLISSRPDEDEEYGVGALCTLIQDREDTLNRRSIDFVKAYAALKIKRDFIPLEKLHYKKAFSNIRKGDIAMSIGGDNYCYADVYRYTMYHEMAKARGAKTVLWGCSVEPELLKDHKIAKDIANYDLITARETISYEALHKVNPNTVLVADPAFVLEAKYQPLPSGFVEGKTIGINVSPLIMAKETIPGLVFENYRLLVEYILKNTDESVALIPHVVWDDNDDRKPLRALYDLFADSGRVVLIEDSNCEVLKGYIARCSCFVGARTHATIAAYSSAVPTLVVGYSVKARGIAKDLLGNEEGFLIPVQSIKKPQALCEVFESFYQKKCTNGTYLLKTLDNYIGKTFDAVQAVRMLKR